MRSNPCAAIIYTRISDARAEDEDSPAREASASEPKRQLTGGQILITTRRDTGWDDIADPIRLDVLDPDPAAVVLTARTGQDDPASQDAAKLLGKHLGFLPLALDQAAAYITQTRITLHGYLQLLREHPADMYAATSGRGQQAVEMPLAHSESREETRVQERALAITEAALGPAALVSDSMVIFRAELENRAGRLLPNEDPDYEPDDEAWPDLVRPQRDALPQPPRPLMPTPQPLRQAEREPELQA